MQALEKAMQDAEWTGVEDGEAPQQAAQPMALGNTSPHFLPKRAEAFLPWSLPGAALTPASRQLSWCSSSSSSSTGSCGSP